jgi:hypothetical protein
MEEAAGGSTDDAVPVVEMGSDGKSSQRWRVVGMGRRARCRVTASPLACSRAGHFWLARRSQNYCPAITTHYYILLHYYYLINTTLLQNYFAITTTLLQIVTHPLLHITSRLLHYYYTIHYYILLPYYNVITS